MNIVNRNERVTMVRHNLLDLPEHPLPAGYEIRPHGPGDEQIWLAVQSAAEPYKKITLELFHGEFGDNPAILSQRQFFLFNLQGKAIGTATAWANENYGGQPFGRIHWVAITPDSQGRGLAKPLLGKVCRTLHEQGYQRAYLATSTARVSAIRLYLSFGFVPELKRSEDAEIWSERNPYIESLRTTPSSMAATVHTNRSCQSQS